jgi:phospholipid-transporting ATPase
MKIIQFDSDKDLETDLKNIMNEATFYQKNIVYGLLISSEILSIIFSEHKLLKLFYKICNRCLSVVCSRVSPKQKAEMVNLIKTSNKAITLAIGDGANDVGMINEANIGIGIYGLEGTQAARASDYAITQFSHLRKLLFFHGREAYRRNTYVVLYNFYKNIIFIIPMLLYGFNNLFSGLTIYDPFIHQMYNTIYTAIPIGWFGVCDMEYEPDVLVKNPKYYIQGIYGKLFHIKIFWEWVINAFIQALVIFLISYYSFRNCDSEGITYDFWVLGEFIYSIIVIIVNFKIVVDTNTHSIYSLTLNAASIALYFLSILAISKIEKTNMFKKQNFTIAGHWNNVILDFKFIFSIYVGVLFCLSFDIFLRKFMILFGFRIEGDKLPPYFDDSVFIDDKKNKGYNDRSYNEPLINNLI